MELIVILALLGGMALLQNWVYRRQAFTGLSYTCRFSQTEVTEGDEIQLIEEISNNKFLPLPWFKAEITTSRFLEFAGSQSLVTEDTRFVPSFFMLKSYQKITRSWRVKCCKRGVYDLNRIVLVATDLLGNVNASHTVDIGQTLTVLPKAADLTTDFSSRFRMTGDHIVKRHLIADPFAIAGVREYTQRDPMNKIHWLASARTGKLMVHNNEYTADQSLAVILNMQSRSYEGATTIDKNKIETAIRVCAGYLEDTLRSGIPVGLYTNGAAGENGPVVSHSFWGKEHILDLLRVLAQLEYHYTEPIRHFLDGTCREITASDIVLITPFLSEDMKDYVAQMQRSGRRVLVVLIGRVGEVEWDDAEFPLFEYTGGEADA